VLGATKILRSRSLRVAVLLFQAVWLNAVVPGHQRGAVALPGETCAACHASAESCCPDMAEGPPARPESPAPNDPASHCAICHFAAALFAAPPIDLSPPAHKFLKTIDPLPPEGTAVIAFCASYYGRAPPAASFQRV
jgi:hypothetical protein